MCMDNILLSEENENFYGELSHAEGICCIVTNFLVRLKNSQSFCKLNVFMSLLNISSVFGTIRVGLRDYNTSWQNVTCFVIVDVMYAAKI